MIGPAYHHASIIGNDLQSLNHDQSGAPKYNEKLVTILLRGSDGGHIEMIGEDTIVNTHGLQFYILIRYPLRQ
jgi:hypothetical protein